MRKFYLLFLLFIGYQVNAANHTVSGTISSNTTWSYDTVFVTGDITISNGAILTISSGTYIEFQGHYKIDVQGAIRAWGIADNRIVFTAQSQATGWAGIRFENNTSTIYSFLQYCTFSYGKADQGTGNDRSGGAIFMYDFSRLKINNCIFSNNYAASYGGAIALEYNASPTISNCLIVNNSSGSTGGGIDIYNGSQPNLYNNTIAYNSSSNGGGLWTSNFTGKIMNCIIYGNSASNSAQIFGTVQNISNCDVEGGYNSGTNIYDTIPDFVSPAAGAGNAYDGLTADYSLKSTSYLIDKGTNDITKYGILDFDVIGKFRYDNKKADIGAYEYISSTEVGNSSTTVVHITSNTTWSGNILLNSSVIVDNGVTLTIQQGTEVIVTSKKYIDIDGRLLAQGTSSDYIKLYAWNTSNGWYGIKFDNVNTSNDTSKIEYCKISYKKYYSNSNIPSYGAIAVRNTSKVLIRNNIISNNYGNYGGGISLYNSSAKVVGNLIVNNQAKTKGAGIWVYGSSSYSPLIANNTIANNKLVDASTSGSGLYVENGATPIVKDGIFYNNQDKTGNHALANNIYPTTGLNISYSCVEGGYSGTGNISSNPLFKNPTPDAGIPYFSALHRYGYNLNSYNFSLQPTSACIDAGTSATSTLNLPALDLAGKTRKYSTAIDMGAYEDKSSLSVCGTISSDEVWDANVININCDVTISDGATVTIVPGTKVLFNGHYKLYVKGAIQATGNEGDTILFTAANTSTGWDGIQIDNPNENSNDSCIFDYCKFEYAKRTPSSYYLSGGAISSKSNKELRITHSRFVNNEAAGNYGNGGAVSILYMHGNYENRRFNHNVFEYNTGKYATFYLRYSNIELQNNVFYKNTVTSGGSFGCSSSGGLFVNNMFANNTTYYGAVEIKYEYSNYLPRFYNNIVVNNEGAYTGGIYVNNIKPEIYNNTIANNYCSVSSRAGGFYFIGNGDANLKSNIIYGNKVQGGLSVQICLDDVAADPKFYNNDIEGGIVVFTGTGAGVQYSGVYKNNIDVAAGFAGASSDAGTSYDGRGADWSLVQGSNLINAGYSNSSSLDIPDYDFNGQTRIYNGRIDIGAIENQQDIVASCTISEDTEWEADTIHVNCDVTVNTGKTLKIKPGTVVLFSGYYEINVEGTIIAEGTPSKKIKFTVSDTTGFYDSTITNGGWNGINFNSVLTVNDSSKFANCIFTYGKAHYTSGVSYSSRYGGAMYIYNTSKISIKNCIFSNNKAYYEGGALYIESSGLEFKNNIVVNNSSGFYGGGIYTDDFTGLFINNTIANNKGKYYGGAYFRSSDFIMKNCIFWGNRAFNYASGSNGAINGSSSQIGYYSSTNSKIINSDIQYGQNKIGYGTQLSVYTDNIDDDPLFLNPSYSNGVEYDGLSGNWNVSSLSPVLNKGKYGSAHGYDYAGNNRVVADTVDIGAFEIQLSERFIDVQPANKELCEGTSGVLTAHATVAANYQWQKNGVNIPGATTNILHKSSVTLSDTGYYNCIISNAYGSISTDTVELAVLLSPTVLTSPASTSECLGSSVTFSASASGSEPITYTWYNSNGALGSGVSNQSYEIGNDTIRNTANGYPTPFGNYYWGNKEQYLILASELTAAGLSAGDISSLAFDVYLMNSCPTLSDFSIKVGSTSLNSLSTTWVSGLSTVYSVSSYQPVQGWNTFGFTSAFTWDGTSNIVVEVCSNNSSWISNGNASVNQTATSFYSTHYYRNDNATVCSSTSAGSIMKQRPNIKFIGSSSASGSTSYTINSITANSASNYYMVATNACGSAQSNGATLGIKYAPSLTPISATDDICEDGSYTYSTTTSQGTTPITYQWYKDGNAINGANALSYNITNADTSDAGIYYCKADNSCGSDSTNQSVLVVNEKPQITSQSSSQSVCEGQSVSFGVTATGTGPLTYQWYKDGNAISGATNNIYTISSVSSSDAATYVCKVSNGCVSTPVSSTGIVLTVNTAPTITSQTGTVDVCAGTAAPFSVTATGTATLQYQWYNANGSITSATNNTYTISSASTSDAGNYYCVVTNGCGNATSNVIPLTVNTAPTVTTQPASLTRCESQSALFSIQTSGTSPITYQWYKGGSAITGATNSSYLISPVSTSDAATYYCKATNSCGNVQSNSVSLTVNVGPSITSQTSSQTVCEGVSPTLQVTTSGTSPITYQWYNDNGIITGATASSYSITSVDTGDAGSYYCIASNGCSSATSNSIVLTVNQSPSINTQPTSSTVCENLSAVFNVSASGTAPLSYQWYDGNGAITGATSSSYLIPQVSTANAGTYYVKISNSCGNLNSNTATLTVNSNVAISSQSSSKTVCDGASPTFSITATGTAPITYQWYKDNTAITSATNNSLALTSVDTSDAATYYVIASNNCNSVQSNAMQLTVNQSPSITTQPVSMSSCEGSSALLSVSATGTAPMTYQWYKNSAVINGATSQSYLIGSTTASDAGSYYVKVTNSCGDVTSNTATLTVNNNVAITSQTGDSTKCTGESMTFSVSTTGTSPVSYQWYYNGTAITGGTSASYTIASVSGANAGDYYCIASNSCNSVQSSTKTLTVNTAPAIIQQSNGSTVCSGSSLTLSVSASGTNPITYQWYKGSTAISGAQSSYYPMYQTTASDAGIYHCVATNSCGNATSNNMTVVVNQSPVITAQSSSTTVCENSNVTLSVTATGTAPLTYQWYNASGSITGATSSSYAINSVDTSDAGTYYCIVTNGCGTAQSNDITVIVNRAPVITAQSGGAVKCVGTSHSFNVSATGTAPLTYQWYNTNGAITGATNSLYIINSVDTSDAGTYYCIVSNGCGNVTSTNKTLIVKQSPSIISQSTSATKCEGQSMLFTVTATGSAPLTYQWYVDTGAVAGANANSYTISNVTTTNAGNYYVKVTNQCGNVVSSTKTLTVNTAPTITSQTTSDTLCQGQSMVFNITTTGTTPMTYQWYKDNSAITGATNNIYMIAGVDTVNAGVYKAVVTNTCGTAQSNNIALTVDKLVNITYQSGDSVRCEGESMTLAVQATGTAPISYQWYKSGTIMQGATQPVKALTNLTTSDGGYYYCVISNSCNSVTTNNKVLTVHSNPQPTLGNDTTFCLGGNVTLTPGYGYNCIWNNGSFNNQLNVTQSGSYWVHVTDQYGCSGESDTVNVSVISPYAGQQLCMAGVDSATQKNVIVWEKTPNQGIVAFNIYKESSTTNVWNLVESKPYDSLSVVFDMTSNPAAHADRYAITVIDSCGNESPKSQIHKTMHLAVSPAVPSGYNLTWNGYQGFTPASYRIWKADSTMKWHLVDSVNANIYMWHDTTSLQKPFWYQIEVLRPGGACNPTKANTNYNTSRSNMANNGIINVSSLSPNFIATPTQGKAPLVVKFYDQTTGGSPTSWYWNFGDGNTSTQQDPAHQYDSVGVYDVTLTVSNADGTKSVTKFGFIDVLVDGIYTIDNQYELNVYPNPYSNSTNIAYFLPNATKVKLEIYNSVGQLVTVLADEEQQGGGHKYEFSAKKYGFSAGVYYLRMTIDNKTTTRKLVEVR